jgi:MYXO-CTERM domain-containing protein
MDGDCGGPNSGAVCDGTAHACVPGCRGSGGNGCGPGMTCSSSDTMVGTCQSSSSSSSSSSSGMGGTGAGDAGAGGAGGNDLAPAKGCGCVVAGEDGGGALLGLAALLAAFGLTAGRRSSRRKVA